MRYSSVFNTKILIQNILGLDDKTCPYFEAESRIAESQSNYDSDEIKDRYDTIDCRDFRITNSGYIFVEYEASCLDKDGKETDSI